MNNYEYNLMQLEEIAVALDDLLPKVVFVGGSTTALFVDEAAYFGIRKTDDVDVIVNVTTLVAYQKLSDELRRLGFKEDTNGPICRWKFITSTGAVTLDVMPIDEKILGFSNRWYEEAIHEASEFTLPNKKVIHLVSPIYLIATKFEAFAGRGEGDYFSHDLEDIVFVMENRERMIFELLDSKPALKAYFSEQAISLLNDDFLNVLPGLLNNPESAKGIENNLKIMSSWGNK